MKIVVLGGGTAGWLTALYAKKIFPNFSVKVIESSSIGILGAGEGATPHLISFLDFLEISTQDLITNCGSIIKNGISFENWSEKNKKYFHAFDPANINFEISEDYLSLNIFESPMVFVSHIENYLNDSDICDFNFMSKISTKNKIPFIFKRNQLQNKILNFDQLSHWSIHFDAKRIADFLKIIGLQRGIELIDAKIENFVIDDNDNVKKIILENKIEISSDFVFDCSGFHRILIGKKMKTKWISYKKNLPMKSAVLFQLQENYYPYTKAVAMDYGWMWNIPIQERTGAGYVFDSDFINEDNAKKEVMKKIGVDVSQSRTVEFNPGTFNEVWRGNVLAIGLSASFFEPLEASSIWMFIRNLNRFFSDKTNLINNTPSHRKSLNFLSKKDSEEVRDFIYLHYITDKNNNEFWKYFLKNTECPPYIKELLDICNYRVPKIDDLGSERMYYTSYYQILFGNNIMKKEVVEDYYKKNNFKEKVLNSYKETKILQDSLAESCVNIEDFIQYLSS